MAMIIMIYVHSKYDFRYTDLPGLVNEEKEPLEIAYCSVAEIDKIIDILIEGFNQQALSKSWHWQDWLETYVAPCLVSVSSWTPYSASRLTAQGRLSRKQDVTIASTVFSFSFLGLDNDEDEDGDDEKHDEDGDDVASIVLLYAIKFMGASLTNWTMA